MPIPSTMPIPRSNPDPVSVDEIAEETKGFIKRVIDDVGKSTAGKQIVIGTASGWATGYLAMKVGKAAAIAAGGGIILLQIASHKGYININWDKVQGKVDKVADQIEKEATGKGPSWMDKVERKVERGAGKVDSVLKKGKRKAKSWYQSAVNDEEPFEFTKAHVFWAAFGLGLALGTIVHK